MRARAGRLWASFRPSAEEEAATLVKVESSSADSKNKSGLGGRRREHQQAANARPALYVYVSVNQDDQKMLSVSIRL